MYSLGVDVGYSAVKLSLTDMGGDVVFNTYAMHKGDIKATLVSKIRLLLDQYHADSIKWAAATGSGASLITEPLGISVINEVQAVLEGCVHTDRRIKSIIEIGGQKAKFITGISDHGKSSIKIALNSSCSAGTGSFLEEQASRLKINIEDYSKYAGKAESIPRIAGRCSVFAKTDITHHQQEGLPVADILTGLAHALVKNYKGTVVRRLPLNKPVMFAGGVGFNQAIVDALKVVFRLDDDDLVIAEKCGNAAAVGAALEAVKNEMVFDVSRLLEYLEQTRDIHVIPEDSIELSPLASFGDGDSDGKHECVCREMAVGEPMYLGVDVGSTSTNLVLVDSNDDIVSHRYLRTLGDPAGAVSRGLGELREEWSNALNIAGVGVTGSGRYMIGKHIGADCIKDEITAQARAAVVLDGNVDTVFEIGGQDSKFIRLKDGVVSDFQMNKVCAAGTGSFIEEQAGKFDIPIDKFGDLALSGDNPINLGERCTVFIETSIAAHLARGASLKDIASGLCYSIARNYLNRVVGQKSIGDTISFQGGVAYNQGVINAFRALTGKKIVVNPFFSVSGALGAALLAKEEMAGKETTFRGFDLQECDEPCASHVPQTSCGDDTGGFNRGVERLVFADYDSTIESDKKTVGIPRALFTYGMFPMFNAFFKTLGYNVVMSDPTSEKTISLGQEFSLDETCYPVKLINGHVAELVQKNVDYIFFPDLYSVEHPGSHTRKNYGCAYMQLAFKIVNQAMELEKKGIELLAPTIAFNMGKEFIMKSFFGMGRRLDRSQQETAEALQAGMKAFHEFETRIEQNGKRVIESLKPDEKVFVIVSKTYGVADPVLNMGIPDKFMSMGYKVLSFFDLPESDISGDHPNMYWPFGQHILEPARLIKKHPNMYAILLTHHCCGPDSVLTHFFKEIMDGKPYLNIEVDEHSSAVGVITRVEAFVNSIRNIPVENAGQIEEYTKQDFTRKINIIDSVKELEKRSVLYLPNIYPYAQIFGEILNRQGLDARVMPDTNSASVDLGRMHTMTNEYFSLTALLGDSLSVLKSAEHNKNGRCAFFVPQTEGAEVHGQYSRLLSAKLDRQGYPDVGVVSPFIEDVIHGSRDNMRMVSWGLLAGDLVRIAPADFRERYLAVVLELAKKECVRIEDLASIARRIRDDLGGMKFDKRIFATGELLVLYNGFLSNYYLRDIENKGHRVLYNPLSECLWLTWRDYIDQNKDLSTAETLNNLAELESAVSVISDSLGHESTFEKNPNDLLALADGVIGYYAGSHGRYREAKILAKRPEADGIITVTSTYENTGIALGILHRGLECEKPVLNLTFDGNRNENDSSKIESFLYYL